MKYQLLTFPLIALFSCCSPMKVRLNSGEKLDLEDTLWPAFQVSPLEDQEKSKQVPHYLPFNHKDFTIFINRIDEASKEVTDLETNPIYESIRLLVNNKSLKHALYASATLGVKSRSSSSDSTTINTKATLELLAEFWSNNNHLYPFCSDVFIASVSCRCIHCVSRYFKLRDVVGAQESLSIKLPETVEFQNTLGFNKPTLCNKYGIIPIAQLNSLKFGLFYGLSDCPSIESPTCLVGNSKTTRNNIIMGFLQKRQAFYSFYRFMIYRNMDDHYFKFLEQFKQIAESICLMHEKGLFCGEICIENIMIVLDCEPCLGNLRPIVESESEESNSETESEESDSESDDEEPIPNFLLKLGDFKESGTFSDYRLQKRTNGKPNAIEENKPQHRDKKSDSFVAITDDEIIKKDWKFFAQFLRKFMEEAKFEAKPKFYALSRFVQEIEKTSEAIDEKNLLFNFSLYVTEEFPEEFPVSKNDTI